MEVCKSPNTYLVVIIGNLPEKLDYLRSKDVRLVESIESGLHPYEQVRELETLTARMNDYQEKVVITTYSPYIMAHLDNLVQGSNNPVTRERQSQHLFNKNANSFISHEKVEVYRTERDKVSACDKLVAIPYSEDKGFDWNTLSEPSVDIQQIFFKIYEEEKPNNG